MIIAGIDYSMSCPAICVYDTSNPLTFENMKFFAMSSGPKKYLKQWMDNLNIVGHLPFDSPEIRYRQIAQWAINILKTENVKEVQLEGYSMGSSSGLVFNIAENTSVLKQMLFDAGISYRSPAPSAVKKNFTGKGNSNKEAMCKQFYDRFGVEPYKIIGCKPYDTPENDLVDACANMLTHPDMVKP